MPDGARPAGPPALTESGDGGATPPAAPAESAPSQEDARTEAHSRPETRRSSFRDRFAAMLVAAVAAFAARLPEGVLWRAADLAGGIAYHVAARRRLQARQNLRRVVDWLAAHGEGPESVRRAAGDERAFEALVRGAFRSHVRSYVEMVLAPRFDARYVRERLLVETPAEADEALAGRRPLILVGMHFGAIEVPGLFAVQRIGSVTCPMETVSNPDIQRYLVRTRGSIGIRLVPLEQAARELRSALKRGEPVGLIGDRDLSGAGVEVELFGAAARIPAGPALLALESGAPLYVSGVRRAGRGRYRGNIRRLTAPAEGTRRVRTRAFVQAEARLFERIVADAPDQWFAVFHPIWPDLTGHGGPSDEAVSSGGNG